MIYKLFLWIRFVWINKTGNYDPATGRYDGAIGMLMDGQVDAYIRPLDYGSIGSQFVGYLNVPFMARSVSPLQLISNNKMVESLSTIKAIQQLLDFLMPSTSFLMLTLAVCLVYWVVTTLFTHFKKSLERSAPYESLLPARIVPFFFTCFIFFIHQFFEASLNTDNVVVSTENLLYSKEQVLKTNKEFCFWETGSEEEFFKSVSSIKSALIVVANTRLHGSIRCLASQVQRPVINSRNLSPFRLQRTRFCTNFTRRGTRRRSVI